MTPEMLRPQLVWVTTSAWLTVEALRGLRERDRLDDFLCFELQVIVLPHANHMPALRCQLAVRIPVTCSVAGNFLPPEFRVGAWRDVMRLAPVPETTVNEYGDSRTCEDDVCRAVQVRQRPRGHAESKTLRMKRRPKPNFGFGVSTAVGSHCRACSRRRCPRLARVRCVTSSRRHTNNVATQSQGRPCRRGSVGENQDMPAQDDAEKLR